MTAGGAQSPFTVTDVRNDVSPRVTVTSTTPLVAPGIVAGLTELAVCPSMVPDGRYSCAPRSHVTVAVPVTWCGVPGGVTQLPWPFFTSPVGTVA